MLRDARRAVRSCYDAAIAAGLADGDPDALALKLDDSFRTRFEGLEVEPRSEVE